GHYSYSHFLFRETCRMTINPLRILLIVQLLFPLFASAMVKAERQTISFDGHERIYYVLAPQGATTPAPLIVLLHGSGRDGMSQIDAWKGLAEKNKLILVAPNSRNSQAWEMNTDGPEFLHRVIEAVKGLHAVDQRRIYIFGHSAGAVFALYMAVLEPEYFAAAAVHAGALQGDISEYIRRAQRKIPNAIWVGTEDQFFKLDEVRNTRDQLESYGFPVQLSEMKGHDHNYYLVANSVNKAVWDFLNARQLSGEPSWETYRAL